MNLRELREEHRIDWTHVAIAAATTLVVFAASRGAAALVLQGGDLGPSTADVVSATEANDTHTGSVEERSVEETPDSIAKLTPAPTSARSPSPR